MSGASRILVVYVTAPPAKAPELARALVEQRLIACANLVPGVRSIYRWEGEVHDEPETLLILKTTADRLAALKDAVGSLHPYQVPEVLALAVEDGSAPYCAWVRSSVAEGAA